MSNELSLHSLNMKHFSLSTCVSAVLLCTLLGSITCKSIDLDTKSDEPIVIYNILNPYEAGKIDAPCTSNEDKWYIIQNPSSSLVLDSSPQGKMTVEKLTAKDGQLWKFESGNRPDWFYIVNKLTGNALQADKDTREVTTGEKTGSLNQQWMLETTNRISNKGMEQNLDINDGVLLPGTSLQVWFNNGNIAQEFILREQSEVDSLKEAEMSTERTSSENDFQYYRYD